MAEVSRRGTFGAGTLPTILGQKSKLRHFVLCAGSRRKLAARPDEEDDMTTNPLMPFGKHRGKPFSEVLRQDPSHLGWLCGAMDGNEAIKRAIRWGSAHADCQFPAGSPASLRRR